MIIGATFCSGIGTPELACPEINWRFASEIEKFPRAVLTHRFDMVDARGGVPEGRHALWGDMTTVRVRTLKRLGIPFPNVVVAGTPCQSYSIAGLRRGLNDDRGNLTLEFVRTVHAFRNAGSLRNLVWENVPGVLSDNTNAFGCFLAGLVGADDPLVPPGAEWGPKTHFDDRSHNVHRTYGWKSCSWPSEGMVEGPLGRAAWGILNAEHFGLAQRRKRVFVVYDTGKGADPAAVLFERKSVHGYHPSRREERERVAPTISARTKGGGGLGTDFEVDGGQTAVATVGATPTVRAGGNSTGGDRPYGTDVDTAESLLVVGGGPNEGTITGAVSSKWAKGTGGPAGDEAYNLVGFVPVGHADYRRGELPTLRASGGDIAGGSEALINDPVYAIQERAVSENPNAGPQGKGYQEGLAYTLEARNKVQGVDHALSAAEQRVDHALRGEGFDASEDGTGRGTPIIPVEPVVYSIMPQNSGKDYKARQVATAQPVMAGGPVGGNQGVDYVVDCTIPFDTTQVTSKINRSTPQVGETDHPLVSNGHPPAIAFSMRGREGGSVPEVEHGGVAPVVRTPAGGSSQTFIAFSSKDYGADANEDVSPTLRAGGHKDSHANAGTPPPVAFNARQDPIPSFETTPPLDTDGTTIGLSDGGWRVRRLTPVECERLQGLPDNWTLIPWRGNRAEPDYSETVAWLISHGLSPEEAADLAGVPDGPRYRAIGNGMALDVIGWILKRIVQFMPDEGEENR